MNGTKTQQAAANVRAELARRRMSAQTLATGVDMNRQTLGRRLSGYSPFTIDELDWIADFFGVSIVALIAESSGNHIVSDRAAS